MTQKPVFTNKSGLDLLDTEQLLYRGTLKKKNQTKPETHLKCLSCAMIQQIDEFHKFNKAIYETQKKCADSEYYNQRRNYKQAMKPFEYLADFNIEAEEFLNSLKENHLQMFGDEMIYDCKECQNNW